MSAKEFRTFCALVEMLMDTSDVQSIAHAQSLTLGIILDERERVKQERWKRVL